MGPKIQISSYSIKHQRWLIMTRLKWHKCTAVDHRHLWTMRSSKVLPYFRQKQASYVYLQVFLCYFIYYYICTCLQFACIQNVAFHDVTLYDDALLNEATIYDALQHCIMLQGIIMCYTILNFMMLHRKYCYTVKCGDPMII